MATTPKQTQQVNKPTPKDRGRLERWVKYLTNPRLTQEQIHERATQLTKAGRDPK